MAEIQIVYSFVISLLLGALIGLEREMTQAKFKHPDFAGTRTFALIAAFGTLTAFISEMVSDLFIVVAFGIFMFIIYGTYQKISEITQHYGLTTEIVAIITFLIGALCYYDNVRAAAAIAIIITILLSVKKDLHNFSKKITKEEFYNSLKFAILAFVVLPFLPNEAYGPLGVLNPYKIWLIVVLISGISFFGYVMMRLFGAQKGIGFTAILGGIASSTAVTLSLSSQSLKLKSFHRVFVLGVVLASSIMFARVILLVSIINLELVKFVAIPLISMIIFGIVISVIFMKGGDKTEDFTNQNQIPIKSPFTLKPAITFATIYVVIMFVSKLALMFFGNKGIIVTSLFSGLADVDAITISIAELAKEGLSYSVASFGILIATIVNSLVKVGLAFSFGDKKFAKETALIMSLMVIVGIITMYSVKLF